MKKFFVTAILIFSNLIMTKVSARENFTVEKLTTKNISEMVAGNVLQKPDIFDVQRLRLLTVSYYDFDGKIHHDGKIIVLDAAADRVITIFKKLYQQKFPLQKISLMNEFNGDDNLAMAANNTSAFNQRNITGESKISIHSYGLAIDINPIQNPYVSFNFDKGSAQYLPIAGAKFANRNQNRPGKPKSNGFAESVSSIFYQNGFNIWGGNWDYPIDYQHFQTSRTLAELLVAMAENDAKEFFKLHIKFLQNQPENKTDELAIYMQNHYPNLIDGYLANKKSFMSEARKITPSFIN